MDDKEPRLLVVRVRGGVRAVAGRHRHRRRRPGTATSTMCCIFALCATTICRGRSLGTSEVQDAVHRRLGGLDRGDHRRADRELDGWARPRGASRRPARFPFFQFGATFGAFLLFIVYLLIALTGFKGQPGENRGPLVAGIAGGLDERRGALRRRHKRRRSTGSTRSVARADLDRGRHRVVLVSSQRGHLASHAPAVARLGVHEHDCGWGARAPRRHPQNRIAASASAGRRPRGRRSARTRRPCGRGARRPGRSRPPGCRPRP